MLDHVLLSSTTLVPIYHSSSHPILNLLCPVLVNSYQLHRDTVSSAKTTSTSWYALRSCQVSVSSLGNRRSSRVCGLVIIHDSSAFRAAFLSHLQFLPARLEVIHVGLNSFKAALHYHLTYLRFQFPLNHVCSTLCSFKVILLKEDRSKTNCFLHHLFISSYWLQALA